MTRNAGIKSSHKRLLAVIFFGLTVAVLCGVALAFFSDRPDEQNKLGHAGTVVVQLIENAPFSDGTSHPQEGQFIDHKTFRGKSVGTLDTYMRAYLKPVVEAYDEALSEWILIPISGSNIVLEITTPAPSEPEDGTWVGVDANGAATDLSNAKFFYYTKILQENDETTNLSVQIVDIIMPEPFLNMEIRYNLHVFIEGAQVKNGLWKKVFNIENLPVGVES